MSDSTPGHVQVGRPQPLPEVEALTVKAEQLQAFDILDATHEKVRGVKVHRKVKKPHTVDVTVDAHDSVMHVPAGESFEILRMTGRMVDALTGEVA